MALLDISESALNDAVLTINRARRGGETCPQEDLLRDMLEFDERLAVYGARSQPMFENPFFNQMAGRWGVGSVNGRLSNEMMMGGPFGMPALRWDASGDAIDVRVFRGAGLEAAWKMMDAMTGQSFIRCVAPCKLASGELTVATLYEPR